MKWISLTVLILAAAAVHGAITQRWTAFAPDAVARDAAHALVLNHDGMACEPIDNDVPVKERSIATSRRYRSPNFVVSTCIISGVPGAVATHTPDVCYTSSGYTMLKDPKREIVTLADGSTATFFVADFEKAKATQVERLRVRWSWSEHGTWEAPDRARWKYMKSPELFKLYIVTALNTEGEEPAAAAEFTKAAFTQYARTLSR